MPKIKECPIGHKVGRKRKRKPSEVAAKKKYEQLIMEQEHAYNLEHGHLDLLPDDPDDLERINLVSDNGRPTSFQLKELKLIEFLCVKGYTDYMIVREINQLREINEEPTFTQRTFENWKGAWPWFFRFFQNWREESVKIVESRLMEQILGEVVWEEKPLNVFDGDGISHIEVVKCKKKMPASTQAIMFYLRSMAPDRYGQSYEKLMRLVRDLTDDQLERRANQLMQEKNVKQAYIELKKEGKE